MTKGGGKRAGQPWRSLEEGRDGAAGDPFADLVARLPETSRRDVLRLMAAASAMAGLAGCDAGPEAAIPYIRQPEAEVPGKPRFYATAAVLNGYAQPVLVETHRGRPTRLDGNPDHPLCNGGIDVFAQASVLELYDPDRSRAAIRRGAAVEPAAVPSLSRTLTDRLAANGGAGFAVLSGPTTSPTLIRQLTALQAQHPGMSLFVHDPLDAAARRRATVRAFGRPLDVVYRLERAEAIVAVEDDPLGPGPHQVPYAAAWIEARREGRGRLFVAESTPSLTGAVAPLRRAVTTERAAALVLALTSRLGLAEGAPGDLSPEEEAWVQTASEALRRFAGRSLLAVGPYLPVDIQAVALSINAALGNLGSTMVCVEPVDLAGRSGVGNLLDLAEAIRARRVETLLVIDSNPVYTAPAGLDMATLLGRVPLTVHLGIHPDETAVSCEWHVPLLHPLESWSDARAVDGTATILQPTVHPIYGGHSPHEFLAALGGEGEVPAREIVRATWREALGASDFEEAWRRALLQGYVEGTAFAPVAVAPGAAVSASRPVREEGLEVVFRPDPTIWDGRFANCSWLQELPKPLTKVTWDNVIVLSPALAGRLGVANGDVLELRLSGRSVRGPAWALPGQAEGTVTAYLGYGRWRAGRIGGAVGYDAYAIRPAENPWRASGAQIAATGERVLLASTQIHHRMEGRDLVRVAAPGEPAAPASDTPQPTLYPEWEYPSYAWGMVIDLDACIGCNACVIACQAENNIPVVGKREVARSREMHWLRVDRYYAGPVDDPTTYFQPVPCMHCEKAPCEMGCPVNATVHGPEGLNQMIYNRCIGTRTCGVFCPYEVRRFNFFDYAGAEPFEAVPQRNPDVTVRDRGVMEKCTYCVQRITSARIEAKKEERPIRDGEVRTACQSVCPTGAIVFGDLNDPDSAVSRARRTPRHYALMEELNTQPRTTYLARIARTVEDA